MDFLLSYPSVTRDLGHNVKSLTSIPFCLGYKNRKNLKTKTYLNARHITLQQLFSSMMFNCLMKEEFHYNITNLIGPDVILITARDGYNVKW